MFCSIVSLYYKSLLDSCDPYMHTLEGCVTGIGVIYPYLSDNEVSLKDMCKKCTHLTTTKHNNAGGICLFLGM